MFCLRKSKFVYLFASENTLKDNYLQESSLQVSLAEMQTLFCVCKEKYVDYQNVAAIFFACFICEESNFLTI